MQVVEQLPAAGVGFDRGIVVHRGVRERLQLAGGLCPRSIEQRGSCLGEQAAAGKLAGGIGLGRSFEVAQVGAVGRLEGGVDSRHGADASGAVDGGAHELRGIGQFARRAGIKRNGDALGAVAGQVDEQRHVDPREAW